MPPSAEAAPRRVRVDHVRGRDTWFSPGYLEWDAHGTLLAVRRATPEDAIDASLSGFALPALPNVHSHAFQRAMAGHAEARGAGEVDSFWTWREEMYDVAKTMTVEDLEVVATWLLVEMLESGSTALGEFHYLHHHADASRPEAREAYAEALLRAADATGLSLTLLPVLYLHGGFDRELSARQRRFGHDNVADFVELWKILRARCAAREGAELGVAFHSVRAVRVEEMLEARQALGDELVATHLHVSEQTQEVEECLAATGERPLRLLLDAGIVGDGTCLVHATHLDEGEIADAARAGAIAGLCPTTEANLGDGVFALPEWLARDGAIAIGSDSHVSIDPLEELRLLEYGQRLARRQRCVAALPARRHVGELLWLESCRGGARAIGQAIGSLQAGARADFVVVDPEHPRIAGHGTETVCDAAIFSASSAASPLREVWTRGKRVVYERKHTHRQEHLDAFRAWAARRQNARS